MEELREKFYNEFTMDEIGVVELDPDTTPGHLWMWIEQAIQQAKEEGIKKGFEAGVEYADMYGTQTTGVTPSSLHNGYQEALNRALIISGK